MVSIYSGLPSMRNQKLLRTVFFYDITQHTVGQPIGPKSLQIIIICCVIPQKSVQLIYFVAEVRNHVQAVEVAYDIILYDNS